MLIQNGVKALTCVMDKDSVSNWQRCMRNIDRYVPQRCLNYYAKIHIYNRPMYVCMYVLNYSRL